MKAQIAEVERKVSAEPKVKIIAYGGGKGPARSAGAAGFTHIE